MQPVIGFRIGTAWNIQKTDIDIILSASVNGKVWFSCSISNSLLKESKEKITEF